MLNLNDLNDLTSVIKIFPQVITYLDKYRNCKNAKVVKNLVYFRLVSIFDNPKSVNLQFNELSSRTIIGFISQCRKKSECKKTFTSRIWIRILILLRLGFWESGICINKF